MMSTSPNPDASVFASIMELHFKELDLIPDQILLNKEKMLPILENCLSHSCLEEGLAEQIAVDKSNSAHRFIKIVHRYLHEAGKEKQAEKYQQKVSTASRVEQLESIKIWNFFTPPPHVFKVMEDMGLGSNPSSFFGPPAPTEVFPIPAPGWRPGQATANE
ncbi:PREDICTED: uncharacterized protein LOC103332031 [Prunus mume]|uniref:Uncharacterized protein LOC103332031 n=1 Tax=Prunus mume TaxID=102107 RepID=A0ABM0P180_PRUMU|nr:PREDICTED: uncharacterized protein LOC103332031 [Prunus mume]